MVALVNIGVFPEWLFECGEVTLLLEMVFVATLTFRSPAKLLQGHGGKHTGT